MWFCLCLFFLGGSSHWKGFRKLLELEDDVEEEEERGSRLVVGMV